jgi:hypothetical protein
MSSKPIDLFLTYQFLQRLSTPFKEWDAYKLGIIDKEGNVLRKSSTFTRPEEVSAWGYFDRMVANLKKLIEKFPGGKMRIASYAAALLLLRENNTGRELSIDSLKNELNVQITLLEENGIVNVVGDGKIAGVGVGPQGEPPVKLKASTKMFKRKLLDVDTKVRT